MRIAEIRRIRKNYSYQCTKFFSHISSEDISGSPYRIIPVANYNIRIREKYRNFSGKSKLKMALLQLYAYFNIRYDHLLDIYLEKKKLHEEEIRRQRAEMVETNIYAIETDIGLHVPNWDIPLVIELLCKQLEAEYPDIEKADESWKEIDWNRVPPEILKELNDKRIKMYSR